MSRLLAWAGKARVMTRTSLGRSYAKQNAKDRSSENGSHRSPVELSKWKERKLGNSPL
jgi:hypothetical protein